MGREERIQCREEQKCPEDEEKEESKFKMSYQMAKYEVWQGRRKTKKASRARKQY